MKNRMFQYLFEYRLYAVHLSGGPVDAAANELKVVIYHPSDFSWGEQYAAQVPASCKLYLQPEWSKAEKMTPLIVEYIKANPKWELSLQLHKYINVP